MVKRRSDRSFLVIVIFLIFMGVVIFSSASLGLLAREGASFSRVALSQILLGLVGGSIALIALSNVHYRLWKKYSFYIFVISLIASVLVFVPGLGIEHAGAKRWILLGSISFQPAEFLKLGFIFYFAAFLSSFRNKISTLKYGVFPSMIIVGIVGAVLLSQPDTGTFVIILITALAMFIASGGRWRHILGFGALSLVGLSALVISKPYVKERILTFLDPSRDPLGAGYQIQQSLIAIGSGEVSGRGFGQSIQKFNYLPEPIGDSIFAVAAEEFGFIGSFIIIAAFLAFAVSGIAIAKRSPDYFGGLLVLGIVILIVSQSFINIGSMLGVVPLTGLPLLFISHGGTALFFTLLEVGIVLNVSKYQRA
ncbi:MAG: putative lipid II flippase FtsW [Patescibacteria group bacterium]|nr:MAG: putative lipid II flippase FtsW [Patescibacteria group bacterium]